MPRPPPCGEGFFVIRAAVLTLLLIAWGLFLTLPATAGLFAQIEDYRTVVLWGIPLAALVLSIVFFPRLAPPAGESPRGPVRRRLLLLAGCAVALLADQSFLGFGYLTDWATFTSGGQEPAERQLAVTALWALPLCLILGIWGWERALRGAVYTGWRRRLPAAAALALSVLTGLALALPPILPVGEIRDLPFVTAALTAVLCREVSLGLVFSRGGGLLVAGLYRGVLWFVEAFVINDWYSLYFPSYNYVAGDPLFYAARAASALLGLAVIVAVARPREALAPDPGERGMEDQPDFSPGG
jgi:hypothetical protein